MSKKMSEISDKNRQKWTENEHSSDGLFRIQTL